MLYIIATPIGNLKDLSLRAGGILCRSDIILAEDTRKFLILKDFIEKEFDFKFKKNQRVISYYKEKEFDKIPQVLDWLKQGKIVSLVSESGMPVVSDPGGLLVQFAQKEGLKYSVVPGPTAFVSAVVLSGFSFSEIVFLGFFPKKKQDSFLKKIDLSSEDLKDPVFVFYESPKRIKSTLKKFFNYFENIQIVVIREMTKAYEEIIFLKNLGDVDKITEKGEFTVVVKISKKIKNLKNKT